MADLAETIRTIPIFSELPREDIAKILGKMEENSFRAGTTIFSQGDRGDAFYLIQSGVVQVVLESAGGRSETIAVLGPQNWFGEMALLSGEPRSATIVAVKDTTVWQLHREDWDELIERHRTWLLHFCAILSKKLTRAEQQYSKGRDVIDNLATEFYDSRPPQEQRFLRYASLLETVDLATMRALIPNNHAEVCLKDLRASRLPLIKSTDGADTRFEGFFRDFLTEKLLAREGKEGKRNLHARIAALQEERRNWQQAIDHFLEAEAWSAAARLVSNHKEQLLDASAPFLNSAIERFPAEVFHSDPRLVHAKAEVLALLQDFGGAARVYKNAIAQKGTGVMGVEAVARYQSMADILLEKGDFQQALNCLRDALNLMTGANTSLSGDVSGPYQNQEPSQRTSGSMLEQRSAWSVFLSSFSRTYKKVSVSRWIGAVLGLAVFSYLWFGPADIGLEAVATKRLALLSLTVIFWIFWVFPEHGAALILALGLILTGLRAPENVLSGFVSTTWFMSLGVLGLGAAITGSGLFYRLSLQLVKLFPLTYCWQTLALGFMGIVITALIPQKSARATIISPMILNLSESLGYKNRSRATTGLFAATFLGLGQLNFLYLTGSTATLLAWGLLPDDVRAQFTWGYWFLATLPPVLVVVAIVLLGINVLFRPETQPRVSYKMVQKQLEILGPLSREEWLTLAMLCFTVTGWLTFSYHGIHAAWISLTALCVLINTGVLGWGRMKQGIDWEFLLYLGATLSIPSMLTEGKIDEWLGALFAPVIFAFANQPVLSFIMIALTAYLLKLIFTTRLTVITLSVALVPLSLDLGISPWVTTMIILMGAEVWFFRFQVDWHTLAHAATDGKGFTYALLGRINPIFALAYIVALLAGIPYWSYLGLIGQGTGDAW